MQNMLQTSEVLEKRLFDHQLELSEKLLSSNEDNFTHLSLTDNGPTVMHQRDSKETAFLVAANFVR